MMVCDDLFEVGIVDAVVLIQVLSQKIRYSPWKMESLRACCECLEMVLVLEWVSYWDEVAFVVECRTIVVST